MSESGGIGLFKGLALCVALVALVAKGVPYLLPAADEIGNVCNRNIQAFDMEGTSIYWKVFEAPCRGVDPNFEIVRGNIEMMLAEDESGEWPKAQCSYAQHNSNGYVWSFGTDLEQIAELDCLEPLRAMQKEKEDNIDYLEYLGDLIKDNGVGQLSNYAMKFF